MPWQAPTSGRLTGAGVAGAWAGRAQSAGYASASLLASAGHGSSCGADAQQLLGGEPGIGHRGRS